MNAFWSYFWPAFAAGLVAGLIAGTIAYRRESKRLIIHAAGAFAAVLLAGLWHGPLGGADRFATRTERNAQKLLVYLEVPNFKAHLRRAPLTRTVLLSGAANDFQRSTIVHYTEQIPGVAKASWSGDERPLPLIVEGSAASLLGFLGGLVLAYLIELRRRHNLQWNW